MKKIIMCLIVLLGALLCCAPIVAAESSSDGIVLGIFDNLFQQNMDIKDLQIDKIFHSHTDVNGNTNNYTTFSFSFKINGDETFDNRKINLTCFDENNTTVGSVVYDIAQSGYYDKINLPNGSDIKYVNMVVYDLNNKVFYNNTTSNIRTDNDIIVDHPPKETKSSSSGTKYVASSKSGKFHTPSCEWAHKIASKNKVTFSSREDAINKGYSPCQVCCP